MSFFRKWNCCRIGIFYRFLLSSAQMNSWSLCAQTLFLKTFELSYGMSWQQLKVRDHQHGKAARFRIAMDSFTWTHSQVCAIAKVNIRPPNLISNSPTFNLSAQRQRSDRNWAIASHLKCENVTVFYSVSQPIWVIFSETISKEGNYNWTLFSITFLRRTLVINEYIQKCAQCDANWPFQKCIQPWIDILLSYQKYIFEWTAYYSGWRHE